MKTLHSLVTNRIRVDVIDHSDAHPGRFGVHVDLHYSDGGIHSICGFGTHPGEAAAQAAGRFEDLSEDLRHRATAVLSAALIAVGRRAELSAALTSPCGIVEQEPALDISLATTKITMPPHSEDAPHTLLEIQCDPIYANLPLEAQLSLALR